MSAELEHTVNGLAEHGLHNINDAFWNLGAPQLVEHAVRRREGHLAANGALVVRTGQFTGRSPKDKYVVRDAGTEKDVNWGSINQPMTPEAFDRMYGRLVTFLETRELFVQDCFAGADNTYRLPV